MINLKKVSTYQVLIITASIFISEIASATAEIHLRHVNITQNASRKIARIWGVNRRDNTKVVIAIYDKTTDGQNLLEGCDKKAMIAMLDKRVSLEIYYQGNIPGNQTKDVKGYVKLNLNVGDVETGTHLSCRLVTNDTSLYDWDKIKSRYYIVPYNP